MYEAAERALRYAQLALCLGVAAFGLWAFVISADGLHTYLMTRPASETIPKSAPSPIMTAPL